MMLWCILRASPAKCTTTSYKETREAGREKQDGNNSHIMKENIWHYTLEEITMRLVSFSTSAIPQVRVGLLQKQEIVDVDLAARALKIVPREQMLDLLDH